MKQTEILVEKCENLPRKPMCVRLKLFGFLIYTVIYRFLYQVGLTVTTVCRHMEFKCQMLKRMNETLKA